jgi:hypothetical protein
VFAQDGVGWSQGIRARVLEERGRSSLEIEVLDIEEGNQLTDGIIRDEDADERSSELKDETAQRRTKMARTAVNLARFVDSLTWVPLGGRDAWLES